MSTNQWWDAATEERVAEALDEMLLGFGIWGHSEDFARAALAAMGEPMSCTVEGETLEDVLARECVYDIYLQAVTESGGVDVWQAEIIEPKRLRVIATGSTIDAAIRSAVAKVTEERQ